MPRSNTLAGLLLGSFICLGLGYASYNFSSTLINIKAMDRTVTVKGLAEKEVKANIAIWPIQFNQVDNDLPSLYKSMQAKTDIIVQFLHKQGFTDSDITISQPSIDDRQAQGYDSGNIKFRYSAQVTISLYTSKVDLLLATQNKMVQLVKDGIAISNQSYGARPEFLYTGLNSIKPQMVQAATQNAREVALKFAKDSDSSLGKIKTASQGQFSISPRDSNTPYIKKVRVVSTLTYYLKD